MVEPECKKIAPATDNTLRGLGSVYSESFEIILLLPRRL